MMVIADPDVGPHAAGEAFADATVLVVGESGLIGRALVTRLAAGRANVVAMSSKAVPGRRSAHVRGWPCDASDSREFGQAFRAIRPQVVFHLATDGRGSRHLELVPATLRHDLVTTVNMLSHCAAADWKIDRVVMTASLEEPPPARAESDDEPTPGSPYAAAKWAAGGYGRMFRALYGLDVRIVRPMMTYGPGQRAFKVVPGTILALLAGRRARIGSGARRVDWVHVDDVVDGLLAAAAVPALPRTVDLGTGTLVTIADCAREIARQLGRPELLDIRPGEQGAEIERAADTETARRLIGFSARIGLADGLAHTIDAYRRHAGEGGTP